MLDIIRKHEYFEWVERGLASPKEHNLKHMQDAWILSILQAHMPGSGMQIAEVGGGMSRVLEQLKARNTCWNVDKFEGAGNGPKGVPDIPGVKIVPAYLGDFDPRLPGDHFDVVFSVSVVEHVELADLPRFFEDCARILKPGGLMLHAIDLYVYDEPHNLERVDRYRDIPAERGLPLEPLEPPRIDRSVTFSCGFASNSDSTMAKWNHLAPALRRTREVSQSVSVKGAWRKRRPGEQHATA